MFQLLESNIVQLVLTAIFGGVIYFATSRLPLLLKLLSYLISIGIIISALFNIGEVYIYNSLYKRAFFYYSDEITTIIAVTFLLALIKRNHILTVLLASSLFLSGGKISLVLLLIMCSMYIYANWRERYKFLKVITTSLALGLVGYCIIITSSNCLDNLGIIKNLQNRLNTFSHVSINPKRQSNCSGLKKCLSAQVTKSVQHRYYTSLAGLWMTVNGGFPGEKYPNSPEAFADLITKANPWGMNDYYNLTYEDWRAMRLVQTPYLAFGSGYGPWILLALISLFFSIGWIALQNIRAGETNEAFLYSIAYITIFMFNHTQSWLKSGSIVLILLGFTSAHIIISYLLRKRIQPVYRFRFLIQKTVTP